MDESGNDMVPVQSTNRSERRLLIVLISAGCVALFLGVAQVFSLIGKPFSPTTIQNTSLGKAGATLSALTKADTDNDGLNDYNELYVYQTSPYITDSDSDGRPDAEEVSGGTDPNCAEGTVCSPLVAATNTPSSNTNLSLTNAVPTSGGPFSADDIRQTLLNAGAPQGTIDGLNDQELLDLYADVLGTGTATNTNSPDTTTTANANLDTPTASPDAEALKNLTPDQMRDFLVQGGADREALDNVDDETLRAIFQEAVNDVSSQ